MKNYFYLVIFILFSSGCFGSQIKVQSGLEEKEKLGNVTLKDYSNISKDAIFEAAKKVFILAGKKDFRIDSYRNRLEVSKTTMHYLPFLPSSSEDYWILSIDEKNNISKAKLKIYRVTDFDDDNKKYLSKKSHDIFWNRLEYLLGITKDWKSCKEIWDFDDGLCDSFDLTDFKEAKKDDIVKNILIKDRKSSKSLNKISEDILDYDIELSIDDSKDDILETKDTTNELKEDEAIDKEIQELDKKVNDNIDITLQQIKEK